MSIFGLIFARDATYLKAKMLEFDALRIPYLIICGEHVDHEKVVYRAPHGKYDAINFGCSLLPDDVDLVIFNDVDTKIHNLRSALQLAKTENIDLLIGTLSVKEGPQQLFVPLFNALRRWFPLAATGELSIIRRTLLNRVLPLQPCKAEDTYILFKALEYGCKVVFCEQALAETVRTTVPEEEEPYKRRVVAGIYQALQYTSPPPHIRFFYTGLPIFGVLLIFLGKKGYYWARGILLGYLDYLRGDKSGYWIPEYARGAIPLSGNTSNLRKSKRAKDTP